MIETRPLIYDQELQDFEKLFSVWGEPNFRAKQLWQGLYCSFWDTPEQFTNLPKSIRQMLSTEFRFSSLSPTTSLTSNDNETQKTLFTLHDGNSIETVLMRYERRRTLCISSQAGCAMGCVFCATGQMGFMRNLTSGEIIEQVLYFARNLQKEEDRLTNIVIMGMGEPFHNYEDTMAAVDRLRNPEGYNFGSRRFTISTVGLLPQITRFAKEYPQINLAISLHAIDDKLRSSLLPINRRYSLDQLFQECLDYIETTHRRITFEWALIRDINDSIVTASKLANRLQVFRRKGATMCHVNIIPLNPTANYPGEATTRDRAKAFQDVLEQNGIPCTIRVRRGIEIQAGCGQLATKAKN
jgi:23S rRNA (adenine2503-C2)-methyltransferase